MKFVPIFVSATMLMTQFECAAFAQGGMSFHPGRSGGMSINQSLRPTSSYSSNQSSVAAPATSSASHSTGVQTYGTLASPSANTSTASSVSPSTKTASTTAKSGKSAADYADSIVSSGLRRTFQVHIPPGADRTKPLPLVMIFHGLGGNGTLMQYLTGFNVAANKKGFVVVYPDGLNRRWDAGTQVNSNDVQFVSDMVNQISQRVKIDSHRIYAVGYSNGGHFAMELACQTRIVAAMAIIGSAMMVASANNCASDRVPSLFFLGTADPLVPSGDADHNATLGKLGDTLGIGSLGSLSVPMAKMGGMMTGEETVEFWAKHNGASTSPYSTQMPDVAPNDGTTVTKNQFGSGGTEVVHYRILNGGHTWPNAFYNGPSDDVGKVTRDIDATDLIADFFAHH